MKSTVPVGTGRTIRPGRPGAGLRLLSGVPQGGHRGQGLPGAGSRRGRFRPGRRVGRRRCRGSLRAAWGADRPHRPLQRRDDQARLQRLPRHEDQLHQRDRERLRRGRRGRHRGRAGDGDGPADRRSLPQCRTRLRRILFPEGHTGAQDPRRQQRLSLSAPQLGDRGERAAEAPRDGQALEAPRFAGRQAGRAPGPRLQARHGRHARGLEPGARVEVGGRRRDGRRLRSRRRGAGPRAASQR